MMADLLGKMIPKVLDIEDQRSGFSLVTPLSPICIKDSMTKERKCGVVEQVALDIVFKIAFKEGHSFHGFKRRCPSLFTYFSKCVQWLRDPR
jgi:hypothetical protein